MNDMDEISYWIYTKRAPCLMNYDNLIKKKSEAALLPPKEEPKPAIELVSPRKRKNRKLSILDDDSESSRKGLNVYFEVSQNQSKPVLESCNSESMGSDIDFNIKNTSIQEKRKKRKVQKNNRTVVHKKNKVVTSTPKTTVNLRRSLRQAQLNSSTQLNSTFMVLNSSTVNGGHHVDRSVETPKQEPLTNGDEADNKRNISVKNKTKTTLQNGQFEDLSDVSGFTANYIRSTKVQSSKTPRKIRCKNSRTLVKEPQESPSDTNMMVCINKATNTGMPKANIINCSTDSSQNIINLVTVKNNNKSARLDKSTSLLKFMESTKSRETFTNKLNKQKDKSNLNISFQSQSSSTSRYPKRNKQVNIVIDKNTAEDLTSPRKRRNTKNCLDFNNSDKKENPEDKIVSRTRSGRIPGLTVCQRENSVLVVSNSTDPVGSMLSINVASSNLAERKKRQTRQVRSKKSINKSEQKDTLKDSSGFMACFSESDDSEPLKQRKYFCT